MKDRVSKEQPNNRWEIAEYEEEYRTIDLAGEYVTQWLAYNYRQPINRPLPCEAIYLEGAD